MRAVLARPQTETLLAAGQEHEHYPEEVLGSLREAGLSDLLGQEPSTEPARATMLHLCALNSLTGALDGSLAVTDANEPRPESPAVNDFPDVTPLW